MITKIKFTHFIDAIRTQHDIDLEFAKSISQLFGCEDLKPYNNKPLYDLVLGLLRENFPPIDNHCEIDHYCFFQNFGRIEVGNEIHVETTEQFYDRLVALYSQQ